MGNLNSRLDFTNPSFVCFSSTPPSREVRIPLHQPLSVALAPRFPRTDKQGEEIEHRLKLELIPGITPTADVVGSEGRIRANVELIEYLMGEEISLFQRGKKWKVRNTLSWLGTSETVKFDDKALTISGKLRGQDGSIIAKGDLEFDLIFCPPDLIIPEGAQEWLVAGSLYISDPTASRNYKWRAAVGFPSRKKSY